MKYSELPFFIGEFNCPDDVANSACNIKNGVIVSLNPEICLQIKKNKDNFHLYEKNIAINFADGIGVVAAEIFCRRRKVKKIAGVEVFERMLYLINHRKERCFFVGSTKENISNFSQLLNKSFPDINYVAIDGYFNANDKKSIIDLIIKQNPRYVFVALGCPRQEIFIEYCIASGVEAVFFGIGGSIDVISGAVKRAPKWMIIIGMEWFYRLIKQPSRWRRQLSLVEFIYYITTGKTWI